MTVNRTRLGYPTGIVEQSGPDPPNSWFGVGPGVSGYQHRARGRLEAGGPGCSTAEDAEVEGQRSDAFPRLPGPTIHSIG